MGKLITSENKDMMVSWMYTWSRQQEMSIHEQRIIIRILELCQDELKGLRIKDNMTKIEHHQHDVYVQMPASKAIFDSNLDAKTIKTTLFDLMGRYFEYEDEKRWWKCSFICNPEYIKGEGIMKFSVNNNLWDVWMNFSRGYREFELNKALALPTTYSLKFYMLVSGNTKPISFSVEDLKKWLGISLDAYKDKNGKDRIDNLEMRVIKPAQKALDETCPYTFIYSKLKANPDNKRSRVIGFTFTPKYQPQFRDEKLEGKKLQAKVSASFVIRTEIYNYLKQQCGFSASDLNNTKEIWLQAQEVFEDPLLEIAMLKSKAREAKKTPQAYIIGAIRGKIADAVNKKK
jgi:hypothetical protein